MTGSATTEKMYRGELDAEEGDRMPRSLEEDYNAARSSEPAKISDENGIEYDQQAMAEAIDAYEMFEAEASYETSGLTENEQALDAFGELFG